MKTCIVFLFVIVSLMSARESCAQCCPYIDGVEIHPASPTANDSITVVFTVTTPNLGTYLGETHTLNGDTLVINACYWQGMLTALQTYVDSITVAPMTAGNHFVRLHATISSDMSECFPIQSNDSVFSFSVSGGGGPMPICDSVFVAPDTIYVQQAIDTAVTVSVTYTGQSDISYSMISFMFNDSTNIDINDVAVTNGVAGPFTFTWDYEIDFNQSPVPDNTVVNADVKIFHDGPGGPVIDCLLPIVLVINESANSIQSGSSRSFKVFPNPASDILEVIADPNSWLTVTDINGKTILAFETTLNISRIDLQGIAPGIYLVKQQSPNDVNAVLLLKQ